MNFLNNIRVAYKQLILAVVAGIALACVSIAGYMGLQFSSTTMDRLYNGALFPVSYLSEARYTVKDLQCRAALVLDAKDLARVKDLENDYDKASKHYAENWETYKKSIAGNPEQLAAAQAVEPKYQEFNKTIGDILKLAETDIPAARALYNERGGKATQDVRESLETLQKMQMDAATTMKSESDTRVDRTIRIMVIISLIALIILVAVSIIVTKGIITPLHEMMDECRRLQAGDFRKMPKSDIRADEFGDMEHIISDLTSTLSGIMNKLSEAVSHIASASEELNASATQSAQASDQVAQSVTNAAGAAASQQESLDKVTVSIDHTSESVSNLDSRASKAASNAGMVMRHAEEGAESVKTVVAHVR